MGVTQAVIEAGKAFISLELRPVEKWGKGIAQMSRRLKSAAMQMGTSAILMATPFVAGARVFAEFSKQMAFVSTMLEDSERYMKSYTATVRMMSIEFGEATTTLSRGLYDILSAGFKPSQGDDPLAMLAVTTKAAKAGMTDAASASEAIIAVLNAYSLSAKDAEMVSDSLFTTVKMGVTTFGELAGNIGMVASTAAAAGVEMDEMNATIALITRGMRAPHAVVALQNILKGFLAPSGESAAFAKQLHEQTGFGPMTLEGIEKKGFMTIIKELAALPSGHLTKLLPSMRAIRGMMILKAQVADIDKVYGEWLTKAGETNVAFNKINKTFGHMIDKIKQAGVLILSYIGEALSESLSSTLKEVLLIASGFGEWIKMNKSLISTTANLIIKLGALAITLLVVAKAMGIIAVVLALLSGPGGIVRLTAMAVGAVAAWAALNGIITGVKNELKEMATLGKIGGIDRQQLAMIGTEASKLSDEYSNLKRLQEERLKFSSELMGLETKISALTSRSELSKRNMRLLEGYRENAKRLRLIVNAQDKILSNEKTGLTAIQAKLKAEEKIVTTVEKQLALTQVMTRIGNRGFFLGFQHTPVLAFSSMSGPDVEQDQLSALKQIVENTGSVDTTGKPGAIVKAIEGIGTE